MVVGEHPGQGPQLYGLDGRVHWPTFVARSFLRGLVLWPVTRFIGGVSGVRGVVTAFAGGTVYTTVEMGFDAQKLLSASGVAAPLTSGHAPSAPNVSQPQVAPGMPCATGMGNVIDVTGYNR